MKFNDLTVTWNTNIIPMKDRDTCTLSSTEALIEGYMSANEPQTLRNQYSLAIKILDAKYKHVFASLGNDINTCENLHVEEQHQVKISLPNNEHLVFV
jgi:hypothetical protein